jgi:hypothetical protein
VKTRSDKAPLLPTRPTPGIGARVRKPDQALCDILQKTASQLQQSRRIFAEDHFALCVRQIDLFEKL